MNYQAELRHLLYQQTIPQSLRQKDLQKNKAYQQFSGKVSCLFMAPITSQLFQIYYRQSPIRTLRKIRAFKWLALGVALGTGALEQIEFNKKLTNCDRYYTETTMHQKTWHDGFLQALQFEKIKDKMLYPEEWLKLKKQNQNQRDQRSEERRISIEDKQDMLRFYYAQGKKNKIDPILRDKQLPQERESIMETWKPPYETNLAENNFKLNPK